MDERKLVGPAGFTSALLERQRRARVSLPLKRVKAPGGAERMTWIAERVKRDALGWLVRQGGWRARKIVVGERRREGRVWDAKIFPALRVRFTAGPLRLLVAAMESSEPLPHLAEGVRDVIRAGLAGSDPATGDLLALHRIVSSLEVASLRPGAAQRRAAEEARCPSCGEPLVVPERAQGSINCPKCDARLAPEDYQGSGEKPSSASERLQVLSRLSPLTLLFNPGRLGEAIGAGSPTAPESHARIAPLFMGDRAMLCSYLDDALASAWLDAETQRRKLAPQAALEDYAATVKGLRCFLHAARDRPDALRPLVSFFHRYIDGFGARAPVCDALNRQAQGFNRASEREAFLRTAGGLFALGRELACAVDDALEAPHVDRTEPQKILIAEHHDRFREVGAEVEAIRRELVGEVG